jgi:hypothetical protein
MGPSAEPRASEVRRCPVQKLLVLPVLATLLLLAVPAGGAAALKTDLVAEPAAPTGASGWVIVAPTRRGAAVEIQVHGLAPDSRIAFHVGDLGKPVAEVTTDGRGDAHVHARNVRLPEGSTVDVTVLDDDREPLLKAVAQVPPIS